jgi:hypothetical protein
MVSAALICLLRLDRYSHKSLQELSRLHRRPPVLPVSARASRHVLVSGDVARALRRQRQLARATVRPELAHNHPEGVWVSSLNGRFLGSRGKAHRAMTINALSYRSFSRVPHSGASHVRGRSRPMCNLICACRQRSAWYRRSRGMLAYDCMAATGPRGAIHGCRYLSCVHIPSGSLVILTGEVRFRSCHAQGICNPTDC